MKKIIIAIVALILVSCQIPVKGLYVETDSYDDSKIVRQPRIPTIRLGKYFIGYAWKQGDDKVYFDLAISGKFESMKTVKMKIDGQEVIPKLAGSSDFKSSKITGTNNYVRVTFQKFVLPFEDFERYVISSEIKFRFETSELVHNLNLTPEQNEEFFRLTKEFLALVNQHKS